MSHWEVINRRICRLLAALFLATGLYGCSTAGVIDKKAGDKSTVSSAAKAKQTPRDTQTPQPPYATVGRKDVEGTFTIQELRVIEEGGQTIILAKFSEPVTQYRHFTLNLPSRILLDIFATVQRMPQPENFRVSTSWINGLKLTAGQGRMRFVVDIAAGTVPIYVVEPEEDGLKVIIGPANQGGSAKKNMLLVQNGKRMVTSPRPVGRESSGAEETSSRRPLPGGVKKEYNGQKISLDFKDADIKNVFRLLAEVSDLNIVVTDDVAKKVTVRLVDIPWDQAMDILLDTNGLGKEQVGNVVRISTVQRLRSERDAIKAAQDAERRLEPLQTVFINVNYARASKMVAKIEKAKILSGRGTVIADDRTNTIFVRDIQKAVDEANTLVSRLDTRTPQVLIESNIIETTPSFARALGHELSFTARIRNNQGNPRKEAIFDSNSAAIAPFSNTLGLTFSIIQDRLGVFRDINSTLSAAETAGHIRIISRPSVVTLNNVTSTIQSLRIVRIALPTGTTNIASGTGSAAGAAVATESVSVGIILTVTPQVSSDGFILLDINVKSSSLASEQSGDAIPDELSREAISNVLVRDGETVVIGGIMKDTREETEAGVPFLKDIPVFGWLFKRVKLKQDFEELMVFITPRIINAGASNLPKAEQLWRNALRKTEGEVAVIAPGPVGN